MWPLLVMPLVSHISLGTLPEVQHRGISGPTKRTNSAIHKAAGLTVPSRSMICLVLFHHSTVPTVKLSMGEWPLGVVPTGSFFGNGW